MFHTLQSLIHHKFFTGSTSNLHRESETLKRSKLMYLGMTFALMATVAVAQTPPASDQKPVEPAATDKTPAAPAPATPAAPPAPPTWSVGPIDFSGLVDAYYDVNTNHPTTAANYRFNQLRNFDVKSDQFSLNMAKFSLSHTADPVGFQVDFGFGRAFDIIHATEKAPEIFRYLEQAYITVKPASMKGFQADFGEFVTSAGAEVIETSSNWNYSRSLLFAWAIPYYHFGLRTSMPVTKSLTAGVQVVNGWNNVEDNNSGKTIGLTAAYTKPKATLSANYYTGPEKNDTNKGFRNLFDATLLLTPKDQFNAYINYDYGTEKRVLGGSDHWTGIAFAAKIATSKKTAITPRIEYYDDASGFTTGTTQKLKEFTLTGEYKMVEGLLARLEYRRDWSNVDFFDSGTRSAATKSQNTLLIGVVAFFGPKR